MNEEYESKHGSTQGIAECLCEKLRQMGKERSMKDAVERDITLRAPYVPCNHVYRNAGARKMTLLSLVRSLSENQRCTQRDRFLKSLADW